MVPRYAAIPADEHGEAVYFKTWLVRGFEISLWTSFVKRLVFISNNFPCAG